MTKNGVSYKELFTIVEDFRKENKDQFDEVKVMFADFHKDEFIPVKDEVDKLKGFRIQAFAIAGLVGVGINFLKDWITGTNK